MRTTPFIAVADSSFHSGDRGIDAAFASLATATLLKTIFPGVGHSSLRNKIAHCSGSSAYRSIPWVQSPGHRRQLTCKDAIGAAFI